LSRLPKDFSPMMKSENDTETSKEPALVPPKIPLAQEITVPAIPRLRNYFSKVEEMMLSQSELSAEHKAGGIHGHSREAILRKFLRDHLPCSMKTVSGEIQDSYGNNTNELDCIIMNANSFQLPIVDDGPSIVIAESVVAVIELKSKLTSSELREAAHQLAKLDSLKVQPGRQAAGYMPEVGGHFPIRVILAFGLASNLTLDQVSDQLCTLPRVHMVGVIGHGSIISTAFHHPTDPPLPPFHKILARGAALAHFSELVSLSPVSFLPIDLRGYLDGHWDPSPDASTDESRLWLSVTTLEKHQLYAEALAAVQRFCQMYPNSKWKPRASALEQQLLKR